MPPGAVVAFRVILAPDINVMTYLLTYSYNVPEADTRFAEIAYCVAKKRKRASRAPTLASRWRLAHGQHNRMVMQYVYNNGSSSSSSREPAT